MVARPGAIVSRRPNSGGIPSGAIHHHCTVICSTVRHRTAILRPLETHELRVRVLLGAPRRGQQIDKEGQDVKGEDEGDDPFEYGSHILPAVEGSDDEDDGEDYLDDDEDELEPEGEAQDAVLAEMHAEALVLGADEDGADDVAGHEEEEEAVV